MISQFVLSSEQALVFIFINKMSQKVNVNKCECNWRTIRDVGNIYKSVVKYFEVRKHMCTKDHSKVCASAIPPMSPLAVLRRLIGVRPSVINVDFNPNDCNILTCCS